MRVFVTGTGRCGSVSFREACRYITNYKTGHETNCGLLEYPDNFIEVSPQLRICTVHLQEKYPDAKWVHLIRSEEACIKSLAALEDGRVMRAYQVLYPSVIMTPSLMDIAHRYYWAENDNLRVLLPNAMTIKLETARQQWKKFWDWIGAEGDFQASVTAWSVKRNTTEERNGCVRS